MISKNAQDTSQPSTCYRACERSPQFQGTFIVVFSMVAMVANSIYVSYSYMKFRESVWVSTYRPALYGESIPGMAPLENFQTAEQKEIIRLLCIERMTKNPKDAIELNAIGAGFEICGNKQRAIEAFNLSKSADSSPVTAQIADVNVSRVNGDLEDALIKFRELYTGYQPTQISTEGPAQAPVLDRIDQQELSTPFRNTSAQAKKSEVKKASEPATSNLALASSHSRDFQRMLPWIEATAHSLRAQGVPLKKLPCTLPLTRARCEEPETGTCSTCIGPIVENAGPAVIKGDAPPAAMAPAPIAPEIRAPTENRIE